MRLKVVKSKLDCTYFESLVVRLFNPRITSERTCIFQDVVYLDLVDLDKSPHNCLVMETTFPDTKTTYSCPHNIVNRVSDIIRQEIVNRRTSLQEKQDKEIEKMQEAQQDILTKLAKLENKLSAITTTTTSE